jgi:FAD synthase
LLVTVGFSFRDTHIFEVVNDAMKHNDGLSVLFTDYSLDSKNNPNLEQLKRRMEEKYQIAFLKATLNGDLSDYMKSDNHD